MWWIPLLGGFWLGGLVGFILAVLLTLPERNDLLTDLTRAEALLEAAERRVKDATWRYEALVEDVSRRTDQAKAMTAERAPAGHEKERQCVACGSPLINIHEGDPLYAQDVFECPTHGPVGERR